MLITALFLSAGMSPNRRRYAKLFFWLQNEGWVTLLHISMMSKKPAQSSAGQQCTCLISTTVSKAKPGLQPWQIVCKHGLRTIACALRPWSSVISSHVFTSQFVILHLQFAEYKIRIYDIFDPGESNLSAPLEPTAAWPSGTWMHVQILLHKTFKRTFTLTYLPHFWLFLHILSELTATFAMT